MTTSPRIIAHRGYSAKYPELTPVAFEKALALPVHGVECDVRLSLDGEVMILHDPVIDRVSDGSGRVSRMTSAALRDHNYGTPEMPQDPLTLPELLEMVAPTDKHLYIETKHPSRYGPMLEEQVVRVLRHHGMEQDERIHVVSFSAAAIVRMRRLAPDIDRIHLRRSHQRWTNPLDVHPGRPTGLGLPLLRAKMKPSLIGRRGLPTYVWTVNDPDDMRWARAQGVDMIATDEVSLALEVLHERT